MNNQRIPAAEVRKLAIGCATVVVFILVILVGVGSCVPAVDQYHRAVVNICMQNSREIGLCLRSYSVDHGGHYPVGKTSTEVFQHLLDEQYVTDPSIFYLREMPGKVPPEGTHLKPENVVWDVTCCVDSSAPDGLPIVYLSGFKAVYQPGAAALPILLPHLDFMAICYKDNSVGAIVADKNGSIPNFIPADFDPKGKTYRQLTP